MPGGLYGGNKGRQGGGELWKVADHCQKVIFVVYLVVKKVLKLRCLKIKFKNILRGLYTTPKGSFRRGFMLANVNSLYGVLFSHSEYLI